MISVLLSLAAIFCFLIIIEALSRKRRSRGEVSRKIIHIVVGSFIAFWPFIMPFTTIQLLCIALLAVIVISKSLRIFKSIHGVKRFTIGELLFPVGIFLASALTTSKWIFAAAVLHMSLADGFAALVGVRYMKKWGRYTFFGQTKTLMGSLTFLSTSCLIMFWIVLVAPTGIETSALHMAILLSLLATGVEAVAPYGSDNLLIPLLVVGTLNSLSAIY